MQERTRCGAYPRISKMENLTDFVRFLRSDMARWSACRRILAKQNSLYYNTNAYSCFWAGLACLTATDYSMRIARGCQAKTGNLARGWGNRLNGGMDGGEGQEDGR